jgi:hypothetical protein
VGGGKRWVRVAPRGASEPRCCWRKPTTTPTRADWRPDGGRVGFFLHTDDFDRDHAAMSARGVRFLEAPRREAYGTVAVFEDLYGNRGTCWSLPHEPSR